MGKKEEEKPKPMDGDLDALSDEFDEEEYLKNIELEEENRKKKEKAKAKKKKKKKKKKNNDDEYKRKVFVSQRPPAKFDAATLKNVFGDKLKTKEIEGILSIKN